MLSFLVYVKNNLLNYVKSFQLCKTLGPTIKTASIELHGVIMC